MEVVDLWTLRIEHEYYERQVTAEFDVQVSSEMRILLMRRNMVWRRKTVGEWCLSSFGDHSVNDDDILELEVVTTGNDVQHVTDFDWPSIGRCYEVKIPVGDGRVMAKEWMTKLVDTRIQHSIMKLMLPVGEMINRRIYPATTTLSFHSLVKYWEYICLPRRREMEKNIRLGDMMGTVDFGNSETVDFMGHEATKIRSLKKILLKERYRDIELALWEQVPVGDSKKERLLARVPYPQPALTLGTDRDTVWGIVYY